MQKLNVLLVLIGFSWVQLTCEGSSLELVDVRKVWGAGPHNAFTDLIRFQNAWWLAFREAGEHGVPPPGRPGGAIRLLRSADGVRWDSVHLFHRGMDEDLRDPKLSLAPDGRLMLLCASAPTRSPESRQSLVYLSRDGLDWTEAFPVGEPDFWLWRVAWAGRDGYGVGYAREAGQRIARLYRGGILPEGPEFHPLVPRLFERGYPNEAAMLFLENGRALCLLRRDGENENTAMLGQADPPYTSWTWKDLGVRVGGPALIRLPDGVLLAATRLYDGRARTALSLIDPDRGVLQEILSLPSGGDTSYAGLVWHEDLLWVSYYSSHEGQSAIYVARVRRR